MRLTFEQNAHILGKEAFSHRRFVAGTFIAVTAIATMTGILWPKTYQSTSMILVNNKRLSEIVPVRPDGRISMPLIGSVAVAGHTASGVANTITRKLDYYVRDPQVTVIVKRVVADSYEDRVRVTGAVEHPASLQFEPGMTVLDAVLDAGGVNSFAAANDTEIHRQVGHVERVIHVKLGNILSEGHLGTNYRLRPGDIVTVPQRLF